MRVAVATWTPRRVGGIEEYLSIVLPAMHEAGLKVAFWHESDEPPHRPRIELPQGVPDLCAVDVGALRELRKWKPDVIYSHGLHSLELEEQVLQIAPAVFFLHTYRGTCISGTKTFTRPTVVPCNRKFGWPCLAHYFPHGCGGDNPVTMWRLFKRQSEYFRLLGQYRAILTHTDHMRDEMVRHGFSAEVIPYPVEAQALGDLPREAGAWHLLFAGRMEVLKGGHYFLEALPKVLSAARRPVRVIMAGDGPQRTQWEARARQLQAAHPDLRVEFTGWVTQDQVGMLMKSVDLLVVPSLWPEPFGSVGPAAAQHGVPAAAFAVGGIPQWLLDGVSGHLAPGDPPTPAGLADAINTCLRDPAHYAALRNGARQVAVNFSMARHMPPLIAAFERACKLDR
jgi:glycosyltransferase involved in cell wall biosynthesis